jgi:hypothetical protein
VVDLIDYTDRGCDLYNLYNLRGHVIDPIDYIDRGCDLYNLCDPRYREVYIRKALYLSK